VKFEVFVPAAGEKGQCVSFEAHFLTDVTVKQTPRPYSYAVATLVAHGGEGNSQRRSKEKQFHAIGFSEVQSRSLRLPSKGDGRRRI
jgi:hypothetical protein